MPKTNPKRSIKPVPTNGKNGKGKTKPQPIPIESNGKNSKTPSKTSDGYGRERMDILPDPMTAARAGESSVSVYAIPYEGSGAKRKMGRPSKYRPEYPDMLVEHLAHGNPIETFAAKVHVSIDTLYEWLKQHEEFSEAKMMGEPKRLAWWLRLGISIVADDPTTQLELLGVKPFLKKEVTTYYPRADREETLKEYHVPRGNSAAYCYIMTNMFRNLGWRNDYRHEVTGAGGGPIQHESKNVHLLAHMTTEELRDLEALHAKVIERATLELEAPEST